MAKAVLIRRIEELEKAQAVAEKIEIHYWLVFMEIIAPEAFRELCNRHDDIFAPFARDVRDHPPPPEVRARIAARAELIEKKTVEENAARAAKAETQPCST